MSKKLLLADDSQAIHKVVSISLEDQDYDVEIANDVSELDNAISNKPEIILLDFGLDESKSGYELTKHVLSKSKNSHVILLFGTFDNIDETALNESGAKGSLSKPFDSTTLINVCKAVSSGESIESKSTSVVDLFSAFDDDASSSSSNDNWEIQDNLPDSAPDIASNNDELENVEDVKLSESASIENNEKPVEQPTIEKAKEELGDWGIEVPGVINAGGDEIGLMPPIIGDETRDIELGSLDINLSEDVPNAPEANHQDDIEEETHYPSDDDLVYPDLALALDDNEESNTPETPKEVLAAAESETLELASDNKDEKPPQSEEDLASSLDEESSDIQNFQGIKLSSKLIPMSELNLEDADKEKLTDPVGEDTKTMANPISTLEEEIESEVNEEDLWAVDETIELEIPAEVIKDSEESEKVEEPATASTSVDASNFSFNFDQDFEDKVREILKPMVEEVVKEALKASAEKVAWEVIPDLAENLIKDELANLSRKAGEANEAPPAQ